MSRLCRFGDLNSGNLDIAIALRTSSSSSLNSSAGTSGGRWLVCSCADSAIALDLMSFVGRGCQGARLTWQVPHLPRPAYLDQQCWIGLVDLHPKLPMQLCPT